MGIRGPFDFDALPVRSLDWIQSEMAKKGLPPLIMASELGEVEFVTTGIKELDDIIKPKNSKKPGGFPVGRIVEIYGLEGVGKTSLTLSAIAGMQKAKKKVLFIDVENALNPSWAKEFGVDLEQLALSTEVTVEGITELVIGYLADFDAIVVDSLAAMIPRAEYEGEAGEAHMGLKARLMGSFMRKVPGLLATSKCSLIFINQQRENLEMFTAKYTTPGGKAVPFATSLRIELKSTKKDKIEVTKDGVKSQPGKWITAHIEKSKVSTPHVEARFKLLY